MRIAICILTLTLCRICLAQAPDRPAPAAGDIPPAASGPSSSAARALPSKTLYMCTYVGDSPLYTVNPTTGKATEIGPMQIDQTCTDLAFRTTAASGTQLFGTSFTNLFSINPATGKAKLLPNAYGSKITDINALVAQPGSGILYGAGSNPPGEFVTINPTTGKATKVGSLGNGIGSAGDLEFLNGQLYGLVTKAGYGNETFLAKISLSAKSMGKATDLLPIRMKQDGEYVVLDDVWGLANRSGVLYAVMYTGQVLTINPANGIATLKGDNSLDQAGLAISP
jgi:hypothetical protein